jgi:hypothetical protein
MITPTMAQATAIITADAVGDTQSPPRRFADRLARCRRQIGTNDTIAPPARPGETCAIAGNTQHRHGTRNASLRNVARIDGGRPAHSFRYAPLQISSNEQ